MGGVALLRKPAISLKRGKIGPKLLLLTNIGLGSYIRAFDWCHNQRPCKGDLEWPLRTQNTCVFESLPRKFDNMLQRPWQQRQVQSPRSRDDWGPVYPDTRNPWWSTDLLSMSPCLARLDVYCRHVTESIGSSLAGARQLITNLSYIS